MDYVIDITSPRIQYAIKSLNITEDDLKIRY